MAAIIAEQERLYKAANALKDKIGWVSDTIDGSVYGAFNTRLLLGGHSADYYMMNSNNVKEGVANAFMACITGDSDVIDAFNELCPELFKVLKGAWLYE